MAWTDATKNLIRGKCNHAGCDKPARHGKAFYCEEHVTMKPGGTPSPAASPGAGPATVPGEDGGAYDPPSTGETRPGGGGATPVPPTPPPAASKPTLYDRLTGKKKDTTAAPTGEVRPARRPKTTGRVKTADFWGDVVSGASGLVARTGDLPVARAMDWTSPVAGEIIEDATKDTFADRLVQPLARNAEKWEDLFDLVGFWSAIGAAERNPANAPAAMRFARKRFVRLLPRIHKKIMAEREQERKATEAVIELMPDIAELFPDGVIPDGVDPVDALMMSLFAMPEVVVPEEVPA
jgi:hypothetical protein